MCRILILADIRPIWGISFHAVVVFGLGKNLLFKSVLGLYDEIFVLNFWRDCTIWPSCALQHRTQSVGAAAKIIDRLWCAWFPLALSAQGRRQEPERPPERMRIWGLQTGLRHDYLCSYANQIMPTYHIRLSSSKILTFRWPWGAAMLNGNVFLVAVFQFVCTGAQGYTYGHVIPISPSRQWGREKKVLGWSIRQKILSNIRTT